MSALILAIITATSYLFVSEIGYAGRVLYAIDDLVQLLGATYVVYVVISQSIEKAIELDALHENILNSEIRQSITSAESDAVRALSAVLHDSVASALSLVADGRNPDAGRLGCHRALKALRSIQDPGDMSSLTVGEAVSEATLGPLVFPVIHRANRFVDDLQLEPRTAVALRRAVQEALQNVARHSGAEVATIDRSLENGQVVVEIVDGGKGLSGSPGWGLQNSILEPVCSVGGSVNVDAIASGGTRISIRVPSVTADETRDALGTAYRKTVEAVSSFDKIAVASLVGLAANAWLGVRYSWGDPTQGMQLLILAIICGFTAIVTKKIVTNPPTIFLLSVWGLGVFLIVPLSIGLAEPTALLNYNSWVIGLLSVSQALLVAVTPPRVAALLLLPLPIATGVAVALSPAPWWQPTGAYGASILLAAVVLLLAGLVRRYQEEIQIARQQLASKVRRVEFARASVVNDGDRGEFVAGRLMPTLAELADAPRHGEKQRQRARSLLAEVRDELALPGLLDEPLRLRLRTARETARVTIVPVEGEPTFVPSVLRVLDRILDPCQRLDHLVVWLPSATHPELRFVVSPPLAGASLSRVLLPLSPASVGEQQTASATDVSVCLETSSR